jgi:hypothetical protein
MDLHYPTGAGSSPTPCDHEVIDSNLCSSIDGWTGGCSLDEGRKRIKSMCLWLASHVTVISISKGKTEITRGTVVLGFCFASEVENGLDLRALVSEIITHFRYEEDSRQKWRAARRSGGDQ